jgi:hypothetical protein
MSNIFCRSPYIIEINEAAQTSSKILIYIWNGTGSAPSTPTYTVSKLIPSSTNLKCLYNISNFIKEYINHNNLNVNYNINSSLTNTNQWCNVVVKRYKNTSTLLSTTTYKAFDGYAFYSDGANYDAGDYHLTEGTYYYHYNSATTIDLLRPGHVVANLAAGYKAKYTDLVTSATVTQTMTLAKVYDLYKVYPSYWANGNKLEITTGGGTVLKTYYFKPIEECKYSPVSIDFKNRYGAWQREFFFKASKTNFSTNSTEYKQLQTSITSYNQIQGQSQVYNANGQVSNSYNSGWVSESFGETIKQIMLSDKILVNGTVRILKTKEMLIQTHLNNKLINYNLEFKDAFDTISNVL